MDNKRTIDIDDDDIVFKKRKTKTNPKKDLIELIENDEELQIHLFFELHKINIFSAVELSFKTLNFDELNKKLNNNPIINTNGTKSTELDNLVINFYLKHLNIDTIKLNLAHFKQVLINENHNIYPNSLSYRFRWYIKQTLQRLERILNLTHEQNIHENSFLHNFAKISHKICNPYIFDKIESTIMNYYP